MSLYSAYIRERTNKDIIEIPEGFVVYEFINNTTVYIEEIFVLPEHRRSDIARDLANQVLGIAKEKGYSKVLGSVDTRARNAEDSIKVLLAYGMTLDSANQNLIIFKKDII